MDLCRQKLKTRFHSDSHRRSYKYEAQEGPGDSIRMTLLLAPHVLGVGVHLTPQQTGFSSCISSLACAVPTAWHFLLAFHLPLRGQFLIRNHLPPGFSLFSSFCYQNLGSFFIRARIKQYYISLLCQLPRPSPAPHCEFLECRDCPSWSKMNSLQVVGTQVVNRCLMNELLNATLYLIKKKKKMLKTLQRAFFPPMVNC